MNSRNEKQSRSFLIPALGIIAAVLFVLLVAKLIKVVTYKPKPEIVKNVERLRAMEQLDASKIEIPNSVVYADSTEPTENAEPTAIGEKNSADGVSESDPSKDDPADPSIPEAKLTEAATKNPGSNSVSPAVVIPQGSSSGIVGEEAVAGKDTLDSVSILQKFSGTAIVGDSITESIWEYGYLDKDVVISRRGVSVSGADDMLEEAISINPRAVFMAFGTNDMTGYGSNVSGFIDSYRVQIDKLKSSLPGVPIYVNCVLPVTDEAIADDPSLQYFADYNSALIEMCSETGCTFIDSSYLVVNDPSLFEPDGTHVVADYYPKWLTLMAVAAGL